MNELWLKIKVWTKGLLFSAVILYALIFVYKNSQPVSVWWWYKRSFDSSALVLLAIAFLAGALSTILVRTTLRTMKQVKELRARNRADRLERDVAEMKDKASRLQTKPVVAEAKFGAPEEGE